MGEILREAVTPKFIILYLYVAAVLFVHFRGSARLKFGRQLLDHSGFFAPYNCLMYMFSKVKLKPFGKVSDFPELSPLRENWKTIRDEAQALYAEGHIQGSDRHNDMIFLAFYKRGWKRFYLKWYDDFMPSAKRLCPKTVELVRAIPNVKAAAYTLLPAGAMLGKHRDPCAGSLRYHLGLITPQNTDDCKIWVDGEEHVWRDGEDVIFDETYVHWALNDTDQPRIILFCDVTRPLHFRVLRGVNHVLSKQLRVTKSQNVESEKVGVLNRVTSSIFRYKYFLKRLKKMNRSGYYAVKWLFISCIVFFVFGRGFVDTFSR